MMNLNRLQVFLEIARTGTLTAAADALSYTPSAVSQQLSKLEAEAGVALLRRTPRGIELTEAGELLRDRARSIVASALSAQAELDALSGLRSGTVRLGSFPSAAYGLVPSVLERFARSHPEIEVVVADGEPHESVLRLHHRQLDLALIFAFEPHPLGTDYFGHWLCPADAVTTETLLHEPFVLCVPDGHRLAHRRVGVEDLRGEVVLGTEATPGNRPLVEACAAHGFRLDLDGSIGTDYVATRGYVAGGRCLALVPQFAAQLPLPGTVCMPLADFQHARSVMLARPAGEVPSPAAARLAEVLRSVVRELDFGVTPDALHPAA